MPAQSTRHIMMMEPVDFHANPQTLETNHYQEPDPDNVKQVHGEALQEFRIFRDTLVANGVVVTTAQGQATCPDDIFVNNWVSTHDGAQMVLYPMMAENRRIERRPGLISLLEKSYDTALDLSGYEKDGRFLESTGALVMDRLNRIAYCALSDRADRGLAEQWAEKMGYKIIFFNTHSHTGDPVYHTDVLMYIGTGYAGLCADCIDEKDRARVVEKLSRTHEIVDISMDQLGRFCGNALEVVGADDEKLLVMSGAAYGAYTEEQKNTFLKYVSKLVYADLEVIERYGGGSARCMLLELH